MTTQIENINQEMIIAHEHVLYQPSDLNMQLCNKPVIFDSAYINLIKEYQYILHNLQVRFDDLRKVGTTFSDLQLHNKLVNRCIEQVRAYDTSRNNDYDASDDEFVAKRRRIENI
jgi:hypothetical protein